MIALLTAILLTLATAASAQTTFRDASGRLTGYVSPDSKGTRTYRDGAGRITGTASTDSNGTTTFRDSSGRITGTRERERRMGR
jgi:YD repeat-containing protein